MLSGGSSQRDHISPVLRNLHGLLVWLRAGHSRLQVAARSSFIVELTDVCTSRSTSDHWHIPAEAKNWTFCSLIWSSPHAPLWRFVANCAFWNVCCYYTWSTTASWSRTPGVPSFAPLTPTSSLFQKQTLDCEQSTRLTAAAWHWVRTL